MLAFALMLTAASLTNAAPGFGTTAVGTSASQEGGCSPTWKVAATPPAAGIEFQAVDALSPKDAWFIGYQGDTGDRPVWHWNGKAITEAPPIPTGPFFLAPRSHSQELAGSFSSDSDGWVMMGSETTGQGIADRWHDGRWTRIPLAVSPDPRTVHFNEDHIVSVSATDAWASGSVETLTSGSLVHHALLEHWDGVRWSVASQPAATDHTELGAFHRISATDIWLDGWRRGADGTAEPFLEHWNGSNWSIVDTPPAARPAVFLGISASGPNDVWAAGAQTMSGTTNTAVPLVEHWNGTAWSVVTNLPDVGNAELTAVYASGPDNVWAPVHEATIQGTTDLLHWDGSTWTTVPSPAPAEFSVLHYFPAMDGTGPLDVWAAGTAVEFQGGKAFPSGQIIHLSCGKD